MPPLTRRERNSLWWRPQSHVPTGEQAAQPWWKWLPLNLIDLFRFGVPISSLLLAQSPKQVAEQIVAYIKSHAPPEYLESDLDEGQQYIFLVISRVCCCSPAHAADKRLPAVLESASQRPQPSIVVFLFQISDLTSANPSIVVHISAPGLVSRLVSWWREVQAKVC